MNGWVNKSSRKRWHIKIIVFVKKKTRRQNLAIKLTSK